MDILEAIREHRLKKALASNRFQDQRDKATTTQIQEFKARFKGEGDPKLVPAMNAARTYYSMLDAYKKTASVKLPTSFNKRAQALWTRVADASVKSGLTVDAFIRAQFVFFHKAFGKAPEPYQLATDAAVERAKSDDNKTLAKKVVGNNISHKGDLAETLRDAEKMMRKLMATHKLTRREVYVRFVKTGLFTFPKQYLAADPVWAEVTSD